jgi:transcriptional regulator with XRE-family HTH domain
MSLNLRQKFGEHIRQLRKGRELTQEALAERSDLSVDAIRRIERGGFSPSLETVHKLSEGLELSLQTLFKGFEHQKRDYVAEMCDFLSKRSAREGKVAWRVVRAIFTDDRS